MTVDAIKDAIVHLSAPERRRLAEWLADLKEDEWDRQMEKDFSPGGRGSHLIDQVDEQIAAGEVESLASGLRSRREHRASLDVPADESSGLWMEEALRRDADIDAHPGSERSAEEVFLNAPCRFR